MTTVDMLAQWITLAGVLISVIASAFAVYNSYTRRAPEIRVIDSSADRNQAEANKAKAESDKANAEAALLRDQRMLNMERDLANACTKIETLEAKVLSQDVKIDELKVENDLLRNHNERLAHQVRSIDPDAIPVPYLRPSRRIEDTKGNQL